MGKLVITDKINGSKKLVELRSKVLSLADDIKTGQRDLEELEKDIDEYKSLESKIVEAKLSMYALVIEALRSGESIYIDLYTAALQKDIDVLMAPINAKKEAKKP